MENGMQIRLSVIIPVYNGKQYLNKLLCSMEKLERCGLEILLVDDCSEDGSFLFCQELEKKNPHISALKNECRKGIAETRNEGLRHALGTYVCFADQDDRIEPDVYLKALQKAEETQAECCLWATCLAFDNGKQNADISFSSEKIYGEDEIRQVLLEQYLRKDDSEKSFTIPGHVWSGMFLKDFLEENQISFFSFVDFEDDCIFMNQVIRHCKKLITLPDTGYYWTRNLKSETYKEKYIEDYWKKSMGLEAWYQNSVYDVFPGQTPPQKKIQKEEARRIYDYIENLCSTKNPAPRAAVAGELSYFFSDPYRYGLLLNEEPPYGDAVKRRQIIRKLILARRYHMACIFLRLYRRLRLLKRAVSG